MSVEQFNIDLKRYENVSFVSKAEALAIANNDAVQLVGIKWYGYVVTHQYDPANANGKNGGHTFNRFIVR